jgi:hypothetical protein
VCVCVCVCARAHAREGGRVEGNNDVLGYERERECVCVCVDRTSTKADLH